MVQQKKAKINIFSSLHRCPFRGHSVRNFFLPLMQTVVRCPTKLQFFLHFSSLCNCTVGVLHRKFAAKSWFVYRFIREKRLQINFSHEKFSVENIVIIFSNQTPKLITKIVIHMKILNPHWNVKTNLFGILAAKLILHW